MRFSTRNSDKLSGLVPGALLLSLSVPAQPQQAKKIPRIGYLAGVPFSAMAERIEAVRQGLRELGYLEEKNIVIEWRSKLGSGLHK